MDYPKLVKMIPLEKWGVISDKLIDSILTSKNDDKMPGQLASKIIRQWQNGTLKDEASITALLQAATMLEPEKTVAAFNELQLTNIADQIKSTSGS